MLFDTLRNVYQALRDEQQNHNEIADKLKVNQKYSSL